MPTNALKKEDELVALFEKQILRMEECSYPLLVVTLLKEKRDFVISKALEFTKENKKHIPFLPAVPPSLSTIHDQIQKVKIGKEKGYSFLNPRYILEIEKVPDMPYYIFCVENGENYLNISPRDAEKDISKKKRFPLNAVEVISLGVHTDVLFHHGVDALGTRHMPDERHESKEKEGNTFMCIDESRAEMAWNYLIEAHHEHGAASCKFRGPQ